MFKSLLSKYMRLQLHRGVPPLFTTLKFLYKDSEKRQAVGEVVFGLIDSLEKHSKFDPKGNEGNCDVVVKTIKITDCDDLF